MRNTKDFAALDEAIMLHIKRSIVHPMYAADLREMAYAISPNSLEFRTIDRRIQAMRKAGKIRYVRDSTGRKAEWQVIRIE